MYVFAKHTRNIVPRSRRYLRASQGLRARVDNNCVICEKVFATRGEVAMSINNVLRAKREKKSLQTPRGSKVGVGNNHRIPNPIENTGGYGRVI